MWIPTSLHSVAWVSWRPPQTGLHYADLYRGIWEFLRRPPTRELEPRAREYLRALREWPYGSLQQDRILWVQMWLRALPCQERLQTAMGDGAYAMLTAVYYEEPPVGVGQRLRAG